MYSIEPTRDFYPLSLLYQASGLEVKPSRQAPAGTLALWQCQEAATGRLLGAATLQTRGGGHFVLAHLAVSEDLRGQGLGARLLEVAEQAAKARGAQTLWLVGKVPEFYQKFHWQTVPRQDAPPISKCLTCPQFEVDCFPSILKKDL